MATDDELTLPFASQEELLKAWARVVAQGALFVPGLVLEDRASFSLAFSVPGRTYAGQRVTPLADAPPAGSAGTWLALEPSEELKALVAAQHEAGRELPPGGRRAQPRYATALSVRFDSLPELAERWVTDISRGGLFARTETPPEVGAKLMVTLVLPDGRRTSLWAQVAHRIGAGKDAGCGLRFVDADSEALAPVEALVASYRQRTKQVLLVDDEPEWSGLVAEGLTALGVEVRVVRSADEAQALLEERLFQLDLVVLNVELPGLDAQGVLERAQLPGHRRGLKVILCSDAAPEELALVPPTEGQAVISKRDNLGKVLARARFELDLYDAV